MSNKYFLFLFILFSSFCFSQEICDNGIDDDGDGKIDLNDSDCICNNSVITSLLPNHSFEEKTSCPSGYSELYLATPWTQATRRDPDYLNKCGFMLTEVKDLGLQNFPDGDGIAGAHYSTDWKEYLGAPLSSPMTAGTNYQLTFNIAAFKMFLIGGGDSNADSLEPVNVTLYGCANSKNLFLNTDSSPNLADPTWIEIGYATYTPISSWGEITISFTPSITLNAIILGPPPVLPQSYNPLNRLGFYSPYFLYDNLLLNTSESFGVNITQNGNFCDSNLVLTAALTKPVSDKKTFQWYQNGIAIIGATEKSYTVPPFVTSLNQYSVKVSDGSTCFVSTKLTVNNTNTTGPTATSPQHFCTSQNPTLNSITVTGTAIKWYDSSTLGSILSNTTPLQDGQTYYASQTINGCESTARIAITVSLISTLPANDYSASLCDDLNDGSETIDLRSYNSNIISDPHNYTFIYYASISGAKNETTSDKISDFSTYKLVLGENKIYVRINSSSSCYAFAELKLFLFSKPLIPINSIIPICKNNAISVSAGNNHDTYIWSTGSAASSIIINQEGKYWVEVEDNHGTINCINRKEFNVVLINKANITSINTVDWTDNENIISVFVTGNGDYEYSVDGINYQDSNQFTGLINGKYTVTVRDKNRCETVSEEVYLLMYPKFFTPNGDGYNDSWKIQFSEIETDINIQIFDKYGKLIKILTSNNDSWDGTYNGLELPSTDYWFVVTRANGHVYKGHFSLKR